MPSYSLRFTDGERNLRDEGIELSDDAAAREFAVRAARELMTRPVSGNDWRRWRMEVTDETARIVLATPLSELSSAMHGVAPAPTSQDGARLRNR